VLLAGLGLGPTGVVPGGARQNRQEAGELGQALRDGRPEARRSAVRALARDGSREAWLLVMEALADPASEVGDAAQLALAGVADERVLADLLGRAGLRAKGAVVRERAAEAVGRLTLAVDAVELVKGLDGEPEETRLLLWSIERLSRAGKLAGERERAAAALEREARGARDGGVRAAAVVALAAVAGGAGAEARASAAQVIERGYDDRDPRVRCAVLMAAAGLDPPRALACLRRGTADGAWSVRVAAVEGLAGLRSLAGVLALVAALERETAPLVRDALVLALQRLSGLKHRADPRPWRDWAQGLPPDWRPGLGLSTPREPQAGGAAAAGRSATSFVGLPVTSLHVCFLIDFSGSMWMPMADGRLPKEQVDVRMREVLEGLPEDAWFNVIPFAHEAAPWSEELVQARRASVRRAVEDFEACQLRGKGNFYAAAVLALEDPDVDTVVTLTDGVPTGGVHSDMDLIVPLLLERNRFRRVRFDAVLVDAPGGARRRWEELSRASGGRCLAVDQP
jgi:HEAT repeat protein